METSSIQPSLAQREILLRAFPCFGSLTSTQAHELCALMTVITVKAHDTIVTEESIVDSVYIIVSGTAEVSHHHQKHKTYTVPVAVLHPGEAIGLHDTGFYSQTGKRTATVTALTEMVLLRLDIKHLYVFLKNHHLESAMTNASQQMLRMYFIKHSLPFANISHERLRWLADKVDELFVPKNTDIFKQGEIGDKSYLLRSGQVAITVTNENNDQQQLAILKSPALFGEATMLTHAPRNATATTVTDCELFVLQQAHLSELIESEKQVAHLFATLMIDRSRPCHHEAVTVHERISAEGQTIVILKNPKTSQYFKLSPEGYFIWQQLDGKHTLQDITLNLAEKYAVFAPNLVTAVISKLIRNGFVEHVDLPNEVHLSAQPFWVKWFYRVQGLCEIRYVFANSDQWITWCYEKYIHYCYTKPAQLIFALLIFAGLATFIIETNPVLNFFSGKHIGLLLLLALFPLSYLELAFHELGHAFTVKAFQREIHYFGIGLSYLRPMVFSDISDMWLAGRKERMLVNIAGVYADFLIAGVASLLILTTSNFYIQSLLWLFALYTYINAVRMLSPMKEMDGYYVLMDWVEKNQLSRYAVLWLINTLPKAITKPQLFRQEPTAVIYWLACLIYLIVVTLITLIVQHFVIRILGIHLTNIYVVLLLPFIVVIFSSLSVLVEIKQQVED